MPSKSTPPVTAYTVEETGIECSPNACAKACGGCLMFLMSLAAISALGVIAGAAFWSAQAMDKVTDGGKHFVDVKMCSCSGSDVNLNITECTGDHACM